MLRQIVFGIVCIVAFSARSFGGHHYYFPAPVVMSPPVVYSAPVFYQPAYAVPITTASYYAPMVPVAPRYTSPSFVASHYYAPSPVFVAPAAYGRPVYIDGRGHLRRFRGVEVEIERDGDIEIDYR